MSNIRLLYSDLTKLPELIDFERQIGELPAEIQERIRRYRYYPAQAVRLTGKILLKKLLQEFELPYSLQQLRYNEYNKPFFNETFDFNITHAEKIVVCAGTMNGKIGIDIEQVNDIDMAPFKDSFTLRELTAIEMNVYPARFFYQLWVRKEAFVKCIGTGVYQPFSSFEVLDDNINYNGVSYYFHKVKIKEGYECCLVTTKAECDITATLPSLH